MRYPDPRTPSVRLLAMIAIPLFAFVALASWAFSSAPGSSPDDDFHLASIWCGLGDREGLCEPTPDGDAVERLVPAPVEQAVCAAQKADVSASCWNGAATGLAEVDRANIDHLYPPLFYGVMSLFASPDVAASIVTIRLVNSLITVGMLTAVFLFLPRSLRPALVLSVLACAVPLGVFVFASTNPSSWALLSAATVWIALYGASISTSRRQAGVLAGLAILGAVLGAGARADAALFAVFGALIATWLGIRRGQRKLVLLLGAAVILATSIAFYLSASQSSAATGGLPGYGSLSFGDLLRNALEIPSLWIGVFGYWPLGWFDTGVPSGVWVLGFAVFAFVLLSGLKGATMRRILAASAAIAAMWFVPFFILARSGAHVGEGVQPRYIMPLMIIALGVAAAAEHASRMWRGWPLVFAAGVLSATNAVALHTNIQRYTTGLDVSALDPGENAEWWWSGVPSPLVVWLVGSVAFALLLTTLLLVNRWSRSDGDLTYAGRSPREIDGPSSGPSNTLPQLAGDASSEADAR